jgi:3-dehydroquinate synthetase
MATHARIAGFGTHGDVLVGRGLLASLGAHARACVGGEACRAFIVLDRGAAAHSPEAALRAGGFEVATHTIEPSEAGKSLATCEGVLRAFGEAGLDRWDVVVAVGGGITGDVAGFCAAVYRRGVRVIQCPTTLLAMVDASVGGKTGVNLAMGGGSGGGVGVGVGVGLAKNMVGAFHDPALVVIDPETLRTLAARLVRCGLAECIKHAMLCRCVPEADAGLLEWTAAHAAGLGAGDVGALDELIARNVALKAGVVRADPRELAPDEAGGRALLNLGHTFGHAIETLPGLRGADGTPLTLMHGEAVGLGLVCAAEAGVRLGVCPAEVGRWVRGVLLAAGLPTRVGGLPAGDVVRARMAHDKKSRAGTLRLIVPTGPGTARVLAGVAPEVIDAALDVIRA